ncbi:MAG: flagellar motor switch phosphatase FliY [Lachnospiraceae bacterium]|nr:flagellar motor switch phosphatase FliY [Lachnospiraceae bacterium]MDY3817881.1 flagellar motor switch phosphatase FliY [Lachnospiraceae bacterium]
MDGVLSQDEINALLNNANSGGSSKPAANDGPLTDEEKDAIGEIANISMGTAATTLFSLVNRKVEISTPVVTSATWDDIVRNYERPCVFIRIAYTVGLDGSNILVLKENDVKIITDLMMGGDGTNTDGELGELHLSAISEAMNQMMGSSATSLSSMLSKTIDISPPVADLIDLQEGVDEGSIDEFLSGEFVKISFRMEIGDLVDSEIMQLYPYAFARDMCQSIAKNMEMDAKEAQIGVADAPKEAAPQPAPQSAPTPAVEPAPQPASQPMQMDMSGMQGMPMMNPQMMNPQMMNPMMYQQPVNVQPAMFTPFSGEFAAQFAKENIDLIMDVPLEVTVELGRTSKSISEILDFAPGTIIELNRIAGEPIDILVNGKYVAKGEVVVIEESFGVRITEIVK